MKTSGFALLGALATACGSDDEQPSLVGEWVVTGDGPYDCALAVAFEDDGTYVEGTMCELEGGALGVEVLAGTYTVGDGTITMKQTHGSCPDAEAATHKIAYDLDGDTLRLGSTGGTLVFARAEGGGDDTGLAKYGCYAQDGSFTPSPISEL